MDALLLDEGAIYIEVPQKRRKKDAAPRRKPGETSARAENADGGSAFHLPSLVYDDQHSDSSESSDFSDDEAPALFFEDPDMFELDSEEEGHGLCRAVEEAQRWKQVRNSNFEAFLSAMKITDAGACDCGNLAEVACDSCTEPYSCRGCDRMKHKWLPFHRRWIWPQGFFEPVEPKDSSLSLFKATHRCSSCCSTSGLMQSSSSRVAVVTEQGQYDLRAPVWVCASCGREDTPTPEQWYQHGYFPGTAVRHTTIYSFGVFELWRGLKSFSPGTSLRAFCHSMSLAGHQAGRARRIDPDRFGKAHSEWSYVIYECAKLVGANPTTCLACGPEPALVHIDGNAKLYRYATAGTASSGETPYFDGVVIENKQVVDEHVAKVDLKAAQDSNRCGLSSWRAGRNDACLPSKKTQDETGLCIATCRHSVVLGCLNMHRGEIFAYTHALHMKYCRRSGFLASDVVCQYWPWSQRVASRHSQFETGPTRPFLSAMHAYGHAYYCQIKYGGFWQADSGWAVMETTEQANALLSRAGNTTKHMSASQRIDYITDLVFFWNERKTRSMMELLIRKQRCATANTSRLRQELQEKLATHEVLEHQLDNMVAELRDLADALCTSDRNSSDNICNGIALCAESIRRKSVMVTRADSSKSRSRTRRALAAEKNRLGRLLATLEAATGQRLTLEAVLEDQLPWESHGVADLAAKRSICEVYMRLCRAEEEIELLQTEAATLLSNVEGAMSAVSATCNMLEQWQAVPGNRPTLAEGGLGRYDLLRLSDGVIAGWLAMCRRELYRWSMYRDSAKDQWCASTAV